MNTLYTDIVNYINTEYPNNLNLLILTEYNFIPIDTESWDKLKLSSGDFIIQIKNKCTLNIMVPTSIYYSIELNNNTQHQLYIIKRLIPILINDKIDIDLDTSLKIESNILLMVLQQHIFK